MTWGLELAATELAALKAVDGTLKQRKMTPEMETRLLQLELISARQRWKRNDRFFAIAILAHTHQKLKALADLRRHLLEEIEVALRALGRLNGMRLEILARKRPRRAHRLLNSGMKAFRRGK